MEQQQQQHAGTLTPEQAAIEEEVIRIVRTADTIQSYQSTAIRTYGYRIMTEQVPGFTRERWNTIIAANPERQRELERERERIERERADAELLRQHRRATCCPDCNAAAAARLRRELGVPADYVPPAVVEEVEEEACEHETARCRYCGADRDCEHDDRSCPDCEICEADHDCRDCGGDPDCEHSYVCQDCEERL